MDFMVSPGQTVFARWKDGYYYPAVVDEILGSHAKVSFLDGDEGRVLKEHMMELQEAFETMNFQGNWKYGGIFFKGVIASHLPMVMHYNDGDVEQIELGQLRGVMPKPKAESKQEPKPKPESKSAGGAVPIQSEKDAVKELKTWLKNGLISKEEFKRRKNLLR